jgi:hypothetical protein
LDLRYVKNLKLSWHECSFQILFSKKLASFTKLRKNLLIVFYLNSIIFTYTCLHDETKINDPENSTFILQDLNLVFKYITEFYF